MSQQIQDTTEVLSTDIRRMALIVNPTTFQLVWRSDALPGSHEMQSNSMPEPGLM
jgi:hypothetical protein